MAHATTQVVNALSTALRRNAATLGSAVSRARRGDVKGIHRLRVATRRLREAVPASETIAALVDLDADDLVRDLRRVTKSLGPVRELDVARSVLEDFAEREAWPPVAVAHVDDYIRRLREQAFADASDALTDFDARRARRALAGVVEKLEQGSGTPSMVGRLRDGARVLAREIELAGTLYAPAALHEIRIAAKKLRYVIELAGDPVPGALRRLRALQSALGKMHDAQVLQHRIQELAATSRDRGLISTLTGMERSIESACRDSHARILKTLPATRQLAMTIAARKPARMPLGGRVLRPGVQRQDSRRRKRIA